MAKKEDEANVEVEKLTPKEEPETTETEPEVDWKARHGAVDAELATLKQSHASVQTELQKSRERQVSPEMFTSLQEEIRAFQGQMLDHFAGTAELTPEMRAEIAKNSEEQRQRQKAADEITQFKAMAKKAGLDDSTIEKIVKESASAFEATAHINDIIMDRAVKAQAEVESHAAVADRKKLEEAGELRVEVGAPASGGIAKSIPTDIDKFREWIASVSQEEYEEKYSVKVKEMMRQGRIK
ncbi:hypothetical protein LCGC14_1868560 [marine sediment metagenome]|uniref:Uncharacterized protein n=1 Tax=marine sediment metagenome TaxID=412755 RepID=A0A0F9GTR9_9ZZZZ